jgi:hemoglobin
MSSLYEEIGPEFIKRAITEFYERAFVDVMIGHFFFKIDKAGITAQQILFASSMLGAKEMKYTGKPLKVAHADMTIRLVHFNRRQVLMREVLADLGLSAELQNAWLNLEGQLRPIIVSSPTILPR